LKPSSTGSLVSLARHTAVVLPTPQGITYGGLVERQQAADSVKHRQTSPVLAARLALEWTDQFRRDPATIEPTRLRPNGRTVDATIERARVERHACRQRFGTRKWMGVAPSDAG
jgi:hypothetical protein